MLRNYLKISVLTLSVMTASVFAEESTPVLEGSSKVLFTHPIKLRNVKAHPNQEETWRVDFKNHIYHRFFPVRSEIRTAKTPPQYLKPGTVIERPKRGHHHTIGNVNPKLFASWLFPIPQSRHREAPYGGRGGMNGFFEINCPDWSGYDVLRADIKSDKKSSVWIGFMDMMVHPPIVGHFTVDNSEWHTLEIDLEDAVKNRGLDLANMSWLWAYVKESGTGEMRNFRLEKRTVQTQYPVVKDPLATQMPEFPEKEKRPSLDIKPNLTPLEKPKTLTFDAGWRAKASQAAIFDQDHILLMHELIGIYPQLRPDSKEKPQPWNRPLNKLFAAQTLDGGKSWSGLNGDKDSTILTISKIKNTSLIDATGDIVMINQAGCTSTPIGAWTRLQKYTFGGSKGWSSWEKEQVMDEESMHCTHGSMDCTRTPDGRIWAALGIEGREYPNKNHVHAKFSESDGKQWVSWRPGFTARIPEMTSQNPVGITAFKDHVAVVRIPFFRNKKESPTWAYFDGKEWCKPKPFPTRYINTVSSMGENNEHLVVATNSNFGVVSWDGNKWNTELNARLHLCKSGDMLMGLAHDSSQNVLNVWHRHANGTWQGPERIPMEAASDVHIPRFCPGNLAAVAYVPRMDHTKIKVMLVPNKLWQEE